MTATLANLIEDDLDGELSPVAFDALCVELSQNADSRREFTKAWLIHSLLHDLVSQQHLQANTLAEMTAVRGEGGRAATVRTRSRFWKVMGGLAAALLVSAMIGTLVYSAIPPRAAAMLTQTANCRWDRSGVSPADGALLKPGDTLKLLEGSALMTFTSGAKVVLQGPADLRIESPSTVTLDRGALNARVPSHAVGFAVKMPLGTVVDLGTEFALRIAPDDSFNVQVFEGMVELQLLDVRGKFDNSPLRLSRGVAVKVDAQNRQPESIVYDEEQRIVMP